MIFLGRCFKRSVSWSTLVFLLQAYLPLLSVKILLMKSTLYSENKVDRCPGTNTAMVRVIGHNLPLGDPEMPETLRCKPKMLLSQPLNKWPLTPSKVSWKQLKTMRRKAGLQNGQGPIRLTGILYETSLTQVLRIQLCKNVCFSPIHNFEDSLRLDRRLISYLIDLTKASKIITKQRE